MLYQSLAVNIIFYGAAFILYRTGVFVPTLTAIAVLFGLGIAINSFITFGMFVGFRRARRNPVLAS